MLMGNAKEVIRLAAAAEEAEKDGRLTKAILNQAVEVASDFDDQGLTPSELIKKATPDFVKGADLRKPEEVELNALQKLFGRTSSQDILYDVYSQSLFGDEVTGADVAASISAPTIKGRKEGPSDITVDLGVLASDERFDSTFKAKISKDITEQYDAWAVQQKKELAAKLDTAKANDDEALQELIVQQQNELIETLQLEARQKYYELMRMHPSIAQQYWQTEGGKVLLSDPNYFMPATVDIFQSDE
jgi:hypothetical protein